MLEEKDIDLLDVISYIIDYVKKKKRVIILLFTVCILITCFYYMSREKKYSGKMTVSTKGIPIHLIDKIFEPLVLGINYGKDSIAAELLGFPEEDIVNIRALNINQVEQHPALRVNAVTFTVEYITTDKTLYSRLQNPTMQFIKQNPYVMQLEKVRMEWLNELKDKLKEQIGRLDSIQQIIPQSIIELEKSGKLPGDYNLGLIYQEMINLKSKETEIIESIAWNDEFHVISGFIIISETHGMRFFIAVGLLAGLVLNAVYFIVYGMNQLLERRKNYLSGN